MVMQHIDIVNVMNIQEREDTIRIGQIVKDLLPRYYRNSV